MISPAALRSRAPLPARSLVISTAVNPSTTSLAARAAPASSDKVDAAPSPNRFTSHAISRIARRDPANCKYSVGIATVLDRRAALSFSLGRRTYQLQGELAKYHTRPLVLLPQCRQEQHPPGLEPRTKEMWSVCRNGNSPELCRRRKREHLEALVLEVR